MHSPEALILRRCYPVPVTFKDLRAAFLTAVALVDSEHIEREEMTHSDVWRMWTWALKEATGALDEVYAVIDGREVRVATVLDVVGATGRPVVVPTAYECPVGEVVRDLLDKADRAGYWAHPHEVRLDLQERPVSRETVAQAVLVGQQYLERSGEGGAA